MVLLAHLSAGNAGDQYRATSNGSRSENVDGVIHLPETVQHLLRTYDTEQTITEELDDFDDIQQNENENKTAYQLRLNNTTYCRGNVHEDDEKIYLYLKGPLPAFRKIVKRLRNSTP